MSEVHYVVEALWVCVLYNHWPFAGTTTTVVDTTATVTTPTTTIYKTNAVGSSLSHG